jgi:hypothetical protein
MLLASVAMEMYVLGARLDAGPIAPVNPVDPVGPVTVLAAPVKPVAPVKSSRLR